MTTSHAKPRASLLRHMHARQILQALQQHGPMSRATITRQTGISGPTVTRTVGDLLGDGLLEEGEPEPGSLGRPGKVVRLASQRVAVLGLVVGVHLCELVAAGLDGQFPDAAVQTFPTPPTYADLLDTVAELARPLMQAGEPELLGLGISVPGLLSRRDRRTLVSPNLHQFDGRRFGDDLQTRLGVEEVAIVQESKALCLAERAYGGARGVDDFAVLDVTDGLGLGVVSRGRILEGASGLAGELGHITVQLDGHRCGCGNVGCLETVATDSAFVRLASERRGRAVTFDELRAGDITVELNMVLQYLAVGVAAVVNVFNPRKLFLHGRFLELAPDVLARLYDLAGRRALGPSWAECELLPALVSKRQGAVAGIVHRLTTGREPGGA